MKLYNRDVNKFPPDEAEFNDSRVKLWPEKENPEAEIIMADWCSVGENWDETQLIQRLVSSHRSGTLPDALYKPTRRATPGDWRLYEEATK